MKNVRNLQATRGRASAVALAVLAVAFMRDDGSASALLLGARARSNLGPNQAAGLRTLPIRLWSGQVHSLSRQGPDRR